MTSTTPFGLLHQAELGRVEDVDVYELAATITSTSCTAATDSRLA
jgi:hypothetical protein